MFRFEHPEFFWLVLLPLVMTIAFYVRQLLSGRDWLKWGTASSNKKLTSVHRLRPVHLWLGLAAMFLLTLAATNPQWGMKTVAVESKSADIYILLDISNSMLAEDVAPSRLEKTKRFALDLSDVFKAERIGLIFFAGQAYMQSPLTTDWHAIQLYLNAANPNQAGTQGTAIGEAVRLALQSRKQEDKQGAGALLILTDGEDHDSDAPSAVEEAAANGWITYIIGAGTEAGATIPMSIDGRKDFKRDESGQPVKTRMNKALMTNLVRKGGGKYYDLSEGDAIFESLKKELAGLERSQMEKRSFSEHQSYFQWFLLPALCMLLWGAIVNYKNEVI